jgi:hypothetical protein
MFRAVDEQESNGSTHAFQPFAARLQSDPPAPCLFSLGVTAPEGPQDTARWILRLQPPCSSAI